MGASRDVPAEEVLALVRAALRDGGLSPLSLAALVTAETRTGEPGLLRAAARLGVPLRARPAAELAAVPVPHPSARVRTALGTPSVAEAAALAEAGAMAGKTPPAVGGELLVPKRKSAGSPARATCAVVRLAGAGGGREGEYRSGSLVEAGVGDAESGAGSGAPAPAVAAAVRQATLVLVPEGAPADPGDAPEAAVRSLLRPDVRVLRYGGGPGAAEGDAIAVRAAREGERVVVLRRAGAESGTEAGARPAAGPRAEPGTGTAISDSDRHRRGSGPALHRGPTAAMNTPPRTDPGHDLRHHGDAEVRDSGAALTDLAVNVRTGTPPAWLAERIAATLPGLAAYPDGRAARRAVAARHGLPEERVLLTSGAAEAFVLLARALAVRRPVVVHPQFTEPEAALRDAGHRVERVLLRAEDGFRLDPAAVPESADLVVLGNPTNPTSVLHPAAQLARLARPGRCLVVDEAFMDAVPGERETLAARTDLPGLVVLRSLTKTWGLAGLRIGYVLAEPETVAALEHAQPLWPVSSPALAAAEACMEPRALAEAEAAARTVAADRARLCEGLGARGLEYVHGAEGPFVLFRAPGAEALRARLRTLGFAVRRGDTFPGLDRDWLRLAVRGEATTRSFLRALDEALGRG